MANEQFVANFGSKLYRLSLKNNFTNLIFICVGSNKIIGDSLGPMVGNKLKTKLNTKVNVWGTLENPVNYMNIEKTWKNIKDKYKNPCIISIDSAMGKNADVGKILVNWGGIFLGEAIKNGIYCAGNKKRKVYSLCGSLFKGEKDGQKDNQDSSAAEAH